VTLAHKDQRNDYELMAALARGDHDSLFQLYDRYSGVMLALCRRVLGDAAEAEQLLLDVFTEVWQRADRYDDGRGSPLTYLLTLCRSRAIDRCRSRRSRQGKWAAHETATDNSLGNVPDPGATPGDGMVLGEQSRLVRQAMDSLTEPQRKVLELGYFDGLSQREIAEATGIPLGTVKSHVRMALIQLRQKLRNME
jgi:RNA polymerase sigma-70 factor (ECF subfamily)